MSVKQVDTWKFTDAELAGMVSALETAAAERQHSRYGAALRDELVAAQDARARREASRG